MYTHYLNRDVNCEKLIEMQANQARFGLDKVDSKTKKSMQMNKNSKAKVKVKSNIRRNTNNVRVVNHV